jgi:hypothetical protein
MQVMAAKITAAVVKDEQRKARKRWTEAIFESISTSLK